MLRVPWAVATEETIIWDLERDRVRCGRREMCGNVVVEVGSGMSKGGCSM